MQILQIVIAKLLFYHKMIYKSVPLSSNTLLIYFILQMFLASESTSQVSQLKISKMNRRFFLKGSRLNCADEGYNLSCIFHLLHKKSLRNIQYMHTQT